MKILNKKKILMFYIPLLLIIISSLLTMYNSRFINKSYTNYLYKQSIWYILFIFTIILFPKFKNIFKYSFWVYFFNIILLFLVLFIGKEINGSKAWFSIKGFSIQPSEFMKISYSLYLTKIISNYKRTSILKELLFLLKIFIIFLIPSVLIFLEPDTGAIIFLIIITITIISLSKIRKIWIILTIFCLATFVGTFFYFYYYKQDLLIKLIGTSFFYRMDRIINFNNNMQLENALISIGNSSFTGIGLNNASIYIPEAATDFAFSVFVSSFGFIGSIILLLSYFIFDTYFILMIEKNKTTSFFTSSFISVFIFSQIYNICMNIGLLPIMGIPLPFLSYGGSSLLVNGIYIGIILKSNNI